MEKNIPVVYMIFHTRNKKTLKNLKLFDEMGNSTSGDLDCFNKVTMIINRDPNKDVPEQWQTKTKEAFKRASNYAYKSHPDNVKLLESRLQLYAKLELMVIYYLMALHRPPPPPPTRDSKDVLAELA